MSHDNSDTGLDRATDPLEPAPGPDSAGPGLSSTPSQGSGPLKNTDMNCPPEAKSTLPELQITEKSGGLGEVARLSGPLVISFVSSSIMGLTDMLVVGQVGTGEQGGVGVGSAISWGLTSMAAGVVSVVSTYVAQAWGAGKRDQLARWTAAGFVAVALFAPFLLAAGVFIPDLVGLLDPTEAIEGPLIEYTTLMVLGSPAMLMAFVFISFYRGVGDTITPMVLTVGAIALNILLDLLLVFGWLGFPEMGVSGAALASVTATSLELVAFTVLYFHGKNARDYLTNMPAALRMRDLISFFKTGFPVGLGWLADNFAFNVMTLIIASSTAAATAAHSIAIQIVNFALMPAIAISVAGSTLVGQYIGAGRPDLSRRAASWTMKLNLALMGTLSLVFVIFRRDIVSLFNPDAEVIADGAFAITMAALFQVFDALSISADGAFRGAGQTVFPMVTRILIMNVLLIPLGLLGAHYGPSPLEGIWTAAVLAISLQGLIMFAKYRKGKWAYHSIEAVVGEKGR